MMKRLAIPIAVAALFAAGLVTSEPRKEAKATQSGFCIKAYNPNYTNAAQYACPSPSPVPTYNGTFGYSANAFTNSVGVNIHLNYPQYSNYSQIEKLLTAAKISHVRGPGDYVLTSPAVGELAEYPNLLSLGIKTDFGITNGTTQSQFAQAMRLLPSGIIEAIEGQNELDTCCNDSSWAIDDINAVKNVLYPNRNVVSPQAMIYGPSTGFSDYAPLGNLSPYINYGNTHDYMGGFYPEIEGYGGVGYGGYGYGSILYNLSNAKQSSIERPVIATEFGFQISNYKRNFTPEAYQGVYLLRQILQHMLDGIPKSYAYELKDSAGQNYGLIRDDYSERPSYVQLAGLQNILYDPGTSATCVIPAKVNTNGVEVMGVCKSTGEYDLILWQPFNTFDPNALTPNTNSPISTPIVYNAGFTPTSISAWTFPYTGAWTNSTSVSAGSISVTDRPTVVVLNGPTPTPLPALPTPLPTVAPTATPVVSPTPTPAPTSTPTTVVMRQITGTDANNTVNVTASFGSNIPYGDYALSAWTFTQFGASRYVVLSPSFMSRIDPGMNQQTNLPVPIACSPITDYQGYEETCQDLWGGYVTEQGGEPSSENWVASTGVPTTAVHYDFSGVDSSAPIGQIVNHLDLQNVTTCQSVTAARIGSVPICVVSAKNGTGFGPGTGLSGGYTNNGWIFDGNLFDTEATTYFFHYPTTTTANQVIPSFSFTQTSTFLNYNVATSIVIQPPAH